MTHTAIRRIPEPVYAFLCLLILGAIGAVFWIVADAAGDLLRRAELAQNTPRYYDQIGELTKAIAEHKDEPDTLYWDHMERGKVYERLEKPGAAAIDFESARGLATSRWKEYNALLAHARAQSGDGAYDKAVASIDEAIPRGRSTSSQPYTERAAIYRLKHDEARALADLDSAIILSPEDYGVRFSRVKLLARMGRTGEAWSALREIARLVATKRDVTRLKTEKYEASGKRDFAQAIAKQSALIALRPENSTYRLERSDFYLWTNQSDKAFADIEAAAQLNPLSTLPRRSLGNAYEYVMQPARGLPELDAAISRDPEDGVLYRDRGLILYKLGRIKEAAADFERSVAQGGEIYSIIWLHLAKLKAGAADARKLTPDEEILLEEYQEEDGGTWPYPVAQFLSAAISEKDLLEAAGKHAEESQRVNQRCEALFYAGLVARIKGKTANGTALLREAQATCHPGFIEFTAARWELRS